MLNLIRSLFSALALLLLTGAGNWHSEPSLFVYDFELTRGPIGNAKLVDTLGFDGLVTRVGVPADVQKLLEYSRYAVRTDDFEVLAFVPYDFSHPASSQVWRDALPHLGRMNAPLWVIVRSAPSRAAVRQLLERMARESEAYGVPTVIYPHWDTDIETAADAATWIRRIGHPNLKNSLHTCHEIRGGNQRRLDRVVHSYASDTALVTIAGAEANAYAGPIFPMANWDDAIMPLDEGAFSLQPFLQELYDSGYDGPVILHTFGITGNPGHLQRSLRRFEQYTDRILP